jgi:thioredoxin 1
MVEKMKKIHCYFCILLLLFFSVSAHAGETPEIPVRNMVTMVDLGADTCVPCKLMAPILEKLESEYKGRAAIVFVDVWKDMDQAKKHGIRVIPTQIFYGKNGKERSRHLGFMSEEEIREQLDMLLANQ